MNAEPPPDEILAILKKDAEFVASLTIVLFWVFRDTDGRIRARNGSAFFLDAGEGPFAVTANHVIEGWRQDRRERRASPLHMGSEYHLDFENRNAIIASNGDIDIATFRVSEEEIRATGKTVYRGYQRTWPPIPPMEGRGIFYAGFPGVVTIPAAPDEYSFGIATAGGIANSISETDVSNLIERDRLVATLSEGLPPENFDFRGMSGGPMLSVINYQGKRTSALAGVLYEGPNPEPDPEEAIAGLEIIRARRAHFILPDGTLDVQRWQSVAPKQAGNR
jgi:hypothetical protein